MGVSLWLVPAAAQMDLIKSVLPKRPSIDHPRSPSSFPVFLPHITLATIPSGPGSQDILLDAIPENQQQVRANFRSLAVGDEYYRSVLINIQSTPDLVDLQGQIAARLRRRGLEPSAPSFPHMSLCYIADEDKRDRDETARALRDTGIINESIDAQAISLSCDGVVLDGFDGVEIWVVKCDGPVETWEVDERRVTLSPRFNSKEVKQAVG